MSDLLNGPPIDGPRIAPRDKPAVPEIEDGPERRTSEYRDDLLLGVYYLLSGRPDAGSTEINDAIRTVSEVIHRVDRHCGPPLPTPPVVAALPHNAYLPLQAVRYLHWLVTNGAAEEDCGPPGMAKADLAECRRHLLREKLGKWVWTPSDPDLDHFAATAKGRALFAGSPVGEVA